MTTSIPMPEVMPAPRAPSTVLRDLSSMAGSWNAVTTTSGSPMHHFAWVSACAETFAGPSSLRVVVLGDPDRPAAIAPLVMRRHVGLPRLELVGLRELQEPTDFIFKGSADAKALAKSLLRLGLPLRLDRVPAASPTATELKQAWRGRGVIITRPALGCPWIALDHRWAEPEPPIESGRRSDLRRAHRNAEKLGPVTCQILSPSPHELDPLLDEMFSVEAASWKGREGTALVCDPVRSAFYRRYAEGACLASVLRLCFLRIGDRVAAAQFAVESDERFWLLKIGYDEAFGRCSPGNLLMRETIRYAANRGLLSYEFLGAPAQWTRMWTDQIRPCVSIRAYPARPWGVAALAADLLLAGLRKLSSRFGRRT